MKIRPAAIAFLAFLTVPALADQKMDEAMAKAEEQLQKGKTEEALKTAQKVVTQNPSSPEAQIFLGRMLARTGSIEEAAAAFAKAVTISAAATPAVRAEALAQLAGTDLLRGSGADALEHAAKAAELNPTASTLAVLARAEARASDATRALATADKAVAAGATAAAAHMARGEALLALRKNDDAVAAFRKAAELDPKLTLAKVGLANALVAGGKAAEGLAEARKATEADPKSAEAFAALGLAVLADNPNNWGDAIGQAQQGAFLNPRNPAIQTAVGKIFEANGSLDQAAQSCKRAIEVDPKYVPALTALINVQARKGDSEGAIASAKALVAEQPQSGDAQLLLGRALLRKLEFVGAVAALEKAATLSPNLAEAHALLGTAYQYSRKTTEAAAAYKKATELDPKNLDYLTTYGLLQGLIGQSDGGIATLKRVVGSPGYKSPDGYLNLGWVYRNTKPVARTDESVAAYKKALELDPKNEQAALGMGWAYSYGRLWDESIAAFKKAAEMDPKVAGEAYNGIAWCYFFKRDLVHARESLEKAQAAGRSDARLKENVEKVEKLIAAGKKAEEEIAKTEGPKQEEGPDMGTVTRNAQSKTPAVRAQAARELRAFGRDGVSFLIYLLRADPEVSVRRAAVASLAAIGPAAKEAIPALQIVANEQSVPDPDADKTALQKEAEEADLKREVKALLQKLQGK